MSAWKVEFRPRAEGDLSKLDKVIRRRIIEKLDWLAANFENIFPLSLAGEFRDFNKLRVGDWRVFYKISWEGKTIDVCYIEHRSKAYKNK